MRSGSWGRNRLQICLGSLSRLRQQPHFEKRILPQSSPVTSLGGTWDTEVSTQPVGRGLSLAELLGRTISGGLPFLGIQVKELEPGVPKPSPGQGRPGGTYTDWTGAAEGRVLAPPVSGRKSPRLSWKLSGDGSGGGWGELGTLQIAALAPALQAAGGGPHQDPRLG